ALSAENAGFNLDKNNPELYLIRGKRLFFENRADDAATEIRKAIQMNGTRVHYHIELCKILMAKEGAEKEAEGQLRKSLAADSDNDAAICHYVRFLKKDGTNKDAEHIRELMKKYREIAPKGECAGEMQ